MKFSVATWNCFGMGQSVLDVIAKFAPFRKRYLAPEVSEECGGTNVLCLQEILSRDSELFFDSLRQKYFPFGIRDHNKFEFISLRGSGLGVGIRDKQTAAHFLPFKSRGVSWDRYARKGALYAQLEVEGRKIDLITAHLQAGYDVESRRVRAQQLTELKNWIAELGAPDRHFIVCGDFNIQGLTEARAAGEYKTLTTMLDGFSDLGADSDLATYHPHPEGNGLAHAYEKQQMAQRIDYIFMRPALRAAEIVCSGFRRFLDKPLASLGEGVAGWASDHYGLKATFEI